jgi:uncharacterized protein (TIGR01777 family)
MSNPKRIILTGATGLIGRKLFAALQGRGYEVVIFSRSPQRARAALPGAAEYVEWSPEEGGPWASAIDGSDAIIHLAGAPIAEGILGQRWTAEVKAAIRDSRVIGTRGIVGAIAAAQARPSALICASGVGYYGFRDATPLDEDAAPGNDFLAQVCVAWEGEATRAQESGARVVSIRTGLLLDPAAGVLPQIMLPFKLHTGGPVLPGTQYYSWIHPDDLIGIYMLALEDERVRGPINASAPTPQTNRAFAEALGQVMGSPSWLPVPAISLRVILGEMADLVVNGQRALPKKAQSLGYPFHFSELEPALRDLLRG